MIVAGFKFPFSVDELLSYTTSFFVGASAQIGLWRMGDAFWGYDGL